MSMKRELLRLIRLPLRMAHRRRFGRREAEASARVLVYVQENPWDGRWREDEGWTAMFAR
jgi:hypothetical protein